MKNNILAIFAKRYAFTLAEIMIALVVIGIITSILLPVAFNNVPNENIMKLKKADATLTKVFSELASSGEYFTAGDLSKKANGSVMLDKEYVCKTFADIVSTKNVNCATTKTNIAYIVDNTKITLVEKYLIPQAMADSEDVCMFTDDTTGSTKALCMTTACVSAYNKQNGENKVITTDGKITLFKDSSGKVTENYSEGYTVIGYLKVQWCDGSSNSKKTIGGETLSVTETGHAVMEVFAADGTSMGGFQTNGSMEVLNNFYDDVYKQTLENYNTKNPSSSDDNSNSGDNSGTETFEKCSAMHTPSTDGYISIKANSSDSNGDYLDNAAKEKLDELCAKYGSEEIRTSDNIIYYQTDPTTPFGKNEYCNKNSDGFLNVYKVMCVDIDGIKKGEEPFGYGVRLDGKIMRGKRAGEWLNKSIQDKE